MERKFYTIQNKLVVLSCFDKEVKGNFLRLKQLEYKIEFKLNRQHDVCRLVSTYNYSLISTKVFELRAQEFLPWLLLFLRINYR